MQTKRTLFSAALWSELRKRLGIDGKARRTRVTSIGDIGIYAIVSPSDMLPCIKIEGPEYSGIAESRFPRMSGLSVTLQTSVPALGDTNFKVDTITLKLTGGDDDMFNALANDILSVVRGADPYSDIENVALRIAQWQEMLTRPKNKTPTVNEALGLLGEMTFLRDFLIPAIGAEAAMQAWIGPLSGKKDFEHLGRCFEIKSSQNENLTSVSISSFEQLDDEGLESLHLVVNEFRQEPETGESLLDVFESLRRTLASDADLLSRLEFLVYGSGWDKESLLEKVAAVKFRLGTKSFFMVDGTFPRYTRRDRRPGTMNMKYEIIIADCLAHAVSEREAETKVKGRA